MLVRKLLLAFGAMATLAAPVAGTVAAAPAIPVEAFAAKPFFTDPQISPDGRMVAAATIHDEQSRLTLIDISTAQPAVRGVALPKDHKLLWVKWAGPSRVVLSLHIPVKRLHRVVHASRLFLYDLPSGQLRLLTRDLGFLVGDKVVHIDPSGAYLLVVIQETPQDLPSVWRVDLMTLEQRQIVKEHPDVYSWFADGKGIVRAGMGAYRSDWWLLYRSSADASFERIIKRKFPRKNEEPQVDAFLPIAGSDTGYAVANKLTGRYALYRYNFRTDELGDLVFGHPQVDIEGFRLDPRSGALTAITYTDERTRTAWLDHEMKMIQALVDRALPRSINRIVSLDHARNRMIVSNSSASNPGTYYVYDRSKGEMWELAKPYAALADRQLAAVEPVRYDARDGLSIPAYLTLPPGRDPKGLPLIVLPHGGPFLRDKWEYEPWVQFLANRGYAVLQPNFRGSTGYGKAFVDAADGQWGRKMQDDLDDGVRWLAQRGTVDPKRVCMMGASYGGYASLWAAARNGDSYRCAVSFAGISDVAAILKWDSSRFVARRYYRDWQERIRGENSFDLDDISPVKSAEKIRIPLLIAHGKNDGTVPLEQSAKMHRALDSRRIAHEYVVYDDEEHSLAKTENAVDFLKRVEAFLSRHNPPG
jgi:dipeptidyl aminopeptidase/acylaminoacyl peptidase